MLSENAGLSSAEAQSLSATFAQITVQLNDEHFDWQKLAGSEARVETGSAVGADATQTGSWYWWKVSLTEWETTLLVKAMVAAAGTLGLYALIAALPGVTLPAAAILGIVAGAVGLGAAYIDLVDWMGQSNGVYFQGTMGTMLYFWHN